jgi:hypothetical protein
MEDRERERRRVLGLDFLNNLEENEIKKIVEFEK